MNRFIFSLLLFLIALSLPGRTRLKVVDSSTGNIVPYVTVFVEGTGYGAQCDENGLATLNFPVATDSVTLRFSVMGYDTKRVVIASDEPVLRIALNPQNVSLKEVTFKQKRSKYSKKNNPALDFARKIREGNDLTNPKVRHENYNYNRYERIALGLNKFNIDNYDRGLIKGQFSFLREHVDTSEVSGTPVLVLSLKEKASEINFRRDPESEKETVNAIKRIGLDDITDQESMQTLVEDFFREIDLYDNDINLLHNRFVSPLSRIAPDFYKFFLTDTVDIDGERCVELSFTPHNTAAFGFTGQVYVPQGDTTMFVRRVVMRLPPGCNVNFIDHMYIRQDYDRAPDGTRLKTRDDMTLELSVLPGIQGLYAQRTTRYDGHNFDQPANAEVFDDPRRVIIPDSAYTRSDSYWADVQGFAPAMHNESRIASLVDGMRSVPLYYWGEKILKILVSGYVATDRDPTKSKVDLGPVNTLISYNSAEGVRLRVGGLTTANLSPHWFGRGYVAYGCRDHKFKYSGELEYSFIPKKYHSREFPVQSLRLTHTYDINQIGQHYLFTNADNFVLSFKRTKDNRVTYQRKTSLLYTLENYSNFSFTAEIGHTRQEATKWVQFKNGYGESFSHYQETGVTLGFRFAPGEKVYQTKSHRVSISRDVPVYQLSHTFAPASFLGNTFTINKTEFSVEKRFWFSAFGYLDGKVKGSHIWSRTPFVNLLIPNANTSFTIQRESFSLMNPMEFINDSQFEWFLTYWANGLIFNNIPYVKKLKLREVFSFRGVVGDLSNRNNPKYNLELYQFPDPDEDVDMNWKPYMEASVGIDNILKCLRLDYVWRLSYRNRPGIDRGGVRIAFHMSF
ncbi:MAG: DUF5686 and carboxypeptidase regulatory-like domain-containing protein [Muribaculaceae bacterium]|nr:DUF5686 and carboxypeptidase regulatory-like domain-containing protein [Muribaculaceae bacterium]